MGHNQRVQELIPDLEDLGVAAATIDAQLREHFRKHGAARQGTQALRPFQWSGINAAPLR